MPNTIKPATIEEYRGITDLVCAEVTKDDASGYETGPVFEIAGVSELTRSTSTSSETHYYNNKAAISISGAGGDEVKINTSAIPMDALAKITGQIYDEETGTLYEGQPANKYYAIGYKTKKTSGAEIYVWRLKGTFSVPDETHKTETDGTDADGQELTYSGIETTHKFAKNNRSEKAINVDTSIKGIPTAFFDTVTTPDTLNFGTV